MKKCELITKSLHYTKNISEMQMVRTLSEMAVSDRADDALF
ncbi:MAG TPA: hypothetical protein PK033_15310 [Acetivibrio sp.]|nr:hypothetical protein [Acetivibrio sp.]